MNFGPVGCSKIVVGEFTLNGNVSLKQTAAACASQGVAQYTWPGTAAVASTSTRLAQ